MRRRPAGVPLRRAELHRDPQRQDQTAKLPPPTTANARKTQLTSHGAPFAKRVKGAEAEPDTSNPPPPHTTPPADKLDDTYATMFRIHKKFTPDIDKEQLAKLNPSLSLNSSSAPRPSSEYYAIPDQVRHEQQCHPTHPSASKQLSDSPMNDGVSVSAIATVSTLAHSSIEEVHNNPSWKPFHCQECDEKFERDPDLLRHVAALHTVKEEKKQYYCDYKKCDRSTLPIHRRDHYREHLRDYHLEDFPGRKKVTSKWFKERRITEEFWRCSNCLGRVDIHKGHKWQCPVCTKECERERIEFRTEGKI